MLSIVTAILTGLVLGVVINILADILPSYRMEDGDEEDSPEPAELPRDTEPAVTPTEQAVATPGWSPSRLTSLRYILVYLVMIGLALVVGQRQDNTVGIVIHMAYLALFTLVAVIDIEHKLVLTVVMIPAFVLAFIEIVLSRRVTLQNAFVGYAIGQMVVMLFYILGGIYISIINARRNEPIREVAFGFGDVTLATFCGMILGYQEVIWMLVLMILIGGAMGFVFLLLRLVIVRKYQPHLAIPYGPAIVIAAGLMLIWGPEITAWMWGAR